MIMKDTEELHAFSGNIARWFVRVFFWTSIPVFHGKKQDTSVLKISKFLIVGRHVSWLWQSKFWIKILVGRSMKMGEGSVSVQLGFLKDFVTSPVPKSAKRTSHVYALCRPYATDFFFETTKILHWLDGSVCIMHFTNTNASWLEQSIDAFESNSSKDLF